MATADELFAKAAEVQEDILTVDLNTRVISIPTRLSVLGVEHDDDVKRMQFQMPQYFGEFDLSEFDIRVNYKNAKGKGDFYLVTDTEIVDEMLTFSWLVDRHAFASAGDVVFSICMKLYAEDRTVIKELNTTLATLPVLKGLETEEAVVSNSTGVFDQVLTRLYAVEAATGKGEQGYYSLAKVEQNEDGAVFTIINQDGETTAVVTNGKDGPAGYAPIKGIDYWNTDDVAAMTAEANARINALMPKSHTITLSKTWSANSQTVSVSDVTSSSVIFVAPNPSVSNSTNYTKHGIQCVSQSTNSLTFRCTSTPTTEILVNVVVFGGNSTTVGNMNLNVVDDDTGNVTIL